MAEKIETKTGEIEQTIQEYKQGIARAIEEERNRFKEISNIFSRAQQEAERVITEASEQAHRISENIIDEAKQKKQQIVNEAEERVKNEAKMKTQNEVERQLKDAQDKAAKLITSARQISEKTANSIVADARQEAEKLVKQLTEKAKREAEQSVKTAGELKKSAEQEATEIKNKAHIAAKQIIINAKNAAEEDIKRERISIIITAKQVAEQIVREAKEKVQLEENQLIATGVRSAERLELGSLSNLPKSQKMTEEIADAESKLQAEQESEAPEIVEAQQRLAKAIEEAISEVEKTGDETDATSPSDSSKKESGNLATDNIISETSDLHEGDDGVEESVGKLELHILPPINFGQLSDFETNLLNEPSLQLLGKGGSDSGIFWFEVNCSKTLPIVNLLKQISPVNEVMKHGNYIKISFNKKINGIQ